MDATTVRFVGFFSRGARLPVLNHEVGERYAIPPSSPATISYTGLPLDAIEDALHRSVAMQNARGILVRKQQKMTGRPVTPLHKGHVGLLACSGMLNGFFGEGETRHIAHWWSVKYVDEFNEEGEAEGETIIRKRERFSHELSFGKQSTIELQHLRTAVNLPRVTGQWLRTSYPLFPHQFYAVTGEVDTSRLKQLAQAEIARRQAV
jgi:hypothetical protein